MCGCHPTASSSVPARPEARLLISNYNGAAGHGLAAIFENGVAKVVATNDFGRPPRVVWSRPLSAAEQAFLAERIDRTPLDRLLESYEDPNVWDGLQLSFQIRPTGGANHDVSVHNRYVKELAALTDAANVLLPPEYRVGYREWKDVKDREEAEAAAEKDPDAAGDPPQQ